MSTQIDIPGSSKLSDIICPSPTFVPTQIDTPGFGDVVDNSNCWQPISGGFKKGRQKFLSSKSLILDQDQIAWASKSQKGSCPANLKSWILSIGWTSKSKKVPAKQAITPKI